MIDLPRPKKFDDEYHRVANEKAKEYYHKHKKERKKAMHDWHKRIKDFADEHNITFEEALKQGAGRKIRRRKLDQEES